MTELPHQDFVKTPTETMVFPSGHDNRDPDRGYPKEVALKDSAVAQVLSSAERLTPTREVGPDR